MLDSQTNMKINQVRLTNHIYHLGLVQPQPTSKVQSFKNEGQPQVKTVSSTEKVPKTKPVDLAISKPKPTQALTEVQLLKAENKNLETRYSVDQRRIAALLAQNSILRSSGNQHALSKDNPAINSLTKLCESSKEQLSLMRQQNSEVHHLISQLQEQLQHTGQIRSEKSISLSQTVDSPTLRRTVMDLTGQCAKMKRQLMERIKQFQLLRDEQSRNQEEVSQLFLIIEEKDRIIEKLLQKVERQQDEEKMNFQKKPIISQGWLSMTPQKVQMSDDKGLNNKQYRKIAWLDKTQYEERSEF